MENYMQYSVMGSVSKIRMKPECFPSKFQCQPDRMKRTAPLQPRSATDCMDIIQEILSKEAEMPAISSLTNNSDVKLEPLYTGIEYEIDENERTECTADQDDHVKLEPESSNYGESDFIVQIIKEEIDVPDLTIEFKDENENVNEMDDYLDIGETVLVDQHGTQLQDHQTSQAGDRAEENRVSRKLECNDCLYTCQWKSHMERHVVTHAKEKKCKSQTRRQKDNRTKGIKQRQKSYNCDTCNSKFRCYSNLKKHIITHKEDKPYKCEICDFRTKHCDYIKIHMRIHTGETPFKCTFCRKFFKQNSSLLKHSLKHTSGKPYKCDLCDYRSYKNYHLKIHMTIHSAEKPFKCDFCDYSCKQNSSLNKHLRIHTGEKPYNCSLCSYKGRSASNLKQHSATHAKKVVPLPSTSFICDVCEFKTSKKSRFKDHVQKMHKENSFTCDFCHYKTTNKALLTEHLSVHEEDTEVDVMNIF